jgi:SagB-type dehydrogenase family enzyme
VNRDVERILAYHERTKHRFERYAEGPGFLDWANQPDPFRMFENARRISLPLSGDRSEAAFSALRAGTAFAPMAVGVEAVSLLLELSLGLSAWKAYGDSRWALRCNPSSGNLHPTECYVICANLIGLPGGLYHYCCRDHCLELRAAPDSLRWEEALPPGGVFMGLSTIPWREAWKYGERAYRYCQHDLGHALAGLRYASALVGWDLRIVSGAGDDALAALMGLDRRGDFANGEEECPETLLWAGPGETPDVDLAGLAALLLEASWSGPANVLSASRVEWAAVRDADAASRRPPGAPEAYGGDPGLLPPLKPLPGSARAADVIRGRRSAVAFDGRTPFPRERFLSLLDASRPRPGVPPLDVVPWPPLLHLLLFVHRVEGMSQGIYLLPRSRAGAALLREEVGRGWLWEEVPSCPDDLPLVCLAREETGTLARVISCHQDIAADSAFSLGMLAEFEDALVQGAWWYRRLFWEAGALGQLLYLEAEAAGFRGTGIGCFFDDEVHRLLGLSGRRFQSLYHFTVGKAVEDARLSTLPPYEHLKAR